MAYIFFRLLETAMLLVVVTLHVTPEGLQHELTYPHIGLSYAYSDESQTFILNSLLLGYALSLYATLALHKRKKNTLWFLSLLIALTCFAGLVNEIVRFFNGHTLQIVIDLSIVLLALDWLMMFGKKIEPKKVVTPEERVAAMLGQSAGE
ncbi:MAG TPA: hypothetical protein VF268_05545 [Gammaproteobacteria bacterium]